VIELPRARRTAAAWVVASMLLALCLAASAGAESSADAIPGGSLGNGIELPHRLWIAGDVTFHGQVPEELPSRVEIDDLSLLARWEATERLTLFGELRMEDFFEAEAGRGALLPSQWQFVFERLYAEALVTPALSVRLGTIYTPFGLWNVVRRSPFTWTVEEPAIADDVFPTHSTGLSLLYQTTWQGWSFDATAYGPVQDTARWGHTGEDDERGWLTGTRVAVGRILGPAFGSVGLNAAGFRGRGESTWGTVFGLDSELDFGGHQVTGELTWRLPGSGQRSVHGLYVQDVIRLEPLIPHTHDLYGVLRFEYFQPGTGRAEIGGILGLFWRPVPSLVLRVDYTFGSRTLERFQPGLNTSISFLF
jgi:hypothetical protein